MQHMSKGNRYWHLSTLPPPFFWHRYGNLHTFPSPTAKPTVASKNSNLFPHDSLVESSSISITTGSDSLPTPSVVLSVFPLESSCVFLSTMVPLDIGSSRSIPSFPTPISFAMSRLFELLTFTPTAVLPTRSFVNTNVRSKPEEESLFTWVNIYQREWDQANNGSLY